MIVIAQYQGVGCISKAIRFQTGRSLWSHTAPVLRDQSIVESWHKGGVSHVDKGSLILNLSFNHTPGTIVDLFRIEATEKQAEEFEKFLLSQVGMKYDFRSVFRFLTGVPASVNNRWFCSEISSFGLIDIGIYIQQRICPAHISPQLHGISPLMISIGNITTIQC